MGDLDLDTTPHAVGDGHYRTKLSADWEIWGPMGGYVSAIALRAVGKEATLPRPASLFVHYLGVAAFDEVDVHVEPIRQGRSAESLRVTMTQGDRPILDGMVCTIAGIDGLEHEVTTPPDVPGPDGLPDVRELRNDDLGPPFPFWENLASRPIHWSNEWPPKEARPPIWQQWLSLLALDTPIADPWLDAARLTLLGDLPSWPSACPYHEWKWPNGPEWMAPSLDLYVAFHQSAATDPWLLVDGYSPIATDGLLGWNARLWTSDRRLAATSTGQAICRPVRR